MVIRIHDKILHVTTAQHGKGNGSDSGNDESNGEDENVQAETNMGNSKQEAHTSQTTND